MNAKNTTSIDVEEFISGVTYPAMKEDILAFAKSKNANSEVLNALKAIPDREYMNSTEVNDEIEVE